MPRPSEKRARPIRRLVLATILAASAIAGQGSDASADHCAGNTSRLILFSGTAARTDGVGSGRVGPPAFNWKLLGCGYIADTHVIDTNLITPGANWISIRYFAEDGAKVAPTLTAHLRDLVHTDVTMHPSRSLIDSALSLVFTDEFWIFDSPAIWIDPAITLLPNRQLEVTIANVATDYWYTAPSSPRT